MNEKNSSKPNRGLESLNDRLYSDLTIEELEERLETDCVININCTCNGLDPEICVTDGSGCTANVPVCGADIYSGNGG